MISSTTAMTYSTIMDSVSTQLILFNRNKTG